MCWLTALPRCKHNLPVCCRPHPVATSANAF
jgi:hypothetical protein